MEANGACLLTRYVSQVSVHAPAVSYIVTFRAPTPHRFPLLKTSKQLQEATAAMQAALAGALGPREEEEKRSSKDARTDGASSGGRSTEDDSQAAWQGQGRRRRQAAASLDHSNGGVARLGGCLVADRGYSNEYIRSEQSDACSKDHMAAWRGQLGARAGDAAAAIAALYLECMVAELRLRLPAPSGAPHAPCSRAFCSESYTRALDTLKDAANMPKEPSRMTLLLGKIPLGFVSEGIGSWCRRGAGSGGEGGV